MAESGGIGVRRHLDDPAVECGEPHGIDAGLAECHDQALVGDAGQHGHHHLERGVVGDPEAVVERGHDPEPHPVR